MMARIYISTTIIGGNQMHKYKRLLIMSVIALLTLVLVGCFKGEQTLEEIDPPKEAEAVDSLDKVAEENKSEDTEVNEGEQVAETVARQLYLLDVNGMIVAQTVELPLLDSKAVATQVLEHLVKNGPVTPILPNGFQAVLPEGTEVLGLDLQEDGTLIVDVSKEFENYEAQDELKILESMTFTLTQFENVDKIKLRINGYPQNEMPVNGTPISEGYSRVNGINLIKTDTIDLLNSQAVTMYYPSEYNDNRYYIPITQHVELGQEGDMYRSMIEALINGPGYQHNVTHVFNDYTSLVNDPEFNNGNLTLVFNENILKDVEKAMISDEVMETLVRTFTEQDHVKSVEVKVEDVEQLINENGVPYEEPVTGKVFMNTDQL